MKKTIKSHEEKETKQRQEVPEGALPAYLLDREKQSRAKILSNTIKQKRKEKAVNYFFSNFFFNRNDTFLFQGKWDVPIPKVKAVSEAEVFRVVQSGKRRSMQLNSNNRILNLFFSWIFRESMETFSNKTLFCW